MIDMFSTKVSHRTGEEEKRTSLLSWLPDDDVIILSYDEINDFVEKLQKIGRLYNLNMFSNMINELGGSFPCINSSYRS